MHGLGLPVAAAAALLWSTASAATCSPAATDKTYDYIIIGSGAGGMPMADKLSEAGKSVLLLERGPPSTGRYGGTMKPKWLEGTNLTRFDVPGLFNQIWADSQNVSCPDLGIMSGCVLGGGVAVNSGLWWKPHPADWDTNFPAGWQSKDVAAATERVFSRIPGTFVPSMDGKIYLPEGYDMLSSNLAKAGYEYVEANVQPERKNHTFAHSTFMLSNGERGGPLATYLATATMRPNFALWTNTMAKRIVRTGGHATGVEIDCGDAGVNGGGHSGVVNVTPKTGRVIVAAGTFGSAKVLFRSGIGRAENLNTIKASADGPTMIGNDSWIDLPVGENLNDHVGTDFQVAHPSVIFYDFYAAWNTPIEADKNAYLNNRTGILTQPAPNLGPIFWEILKGKDGIDRHFHYQSRVEGNTNTTMTVTQYLGTGSQSRGSLTISQKLDVSIKKQPYLNDAAGADKAAVLQSFKNLQASLAGAPNVTWIVPTPGQDPEAFINSILPIYAKRNSNHWIGTSRMGTDDGRVAGGKAVVDTNTKVYGTDNIFVVDASVFPGMITANPSAAITIVSEHAATKILALAPPA